MKKVALFDMDNTILQGRFIKKAADVLGFSPELHQVWSDDEEPFETTRKIAALFRGRSLHDIQCVADSIPLVADTAEVVAELHSRGYHCGIVTDSYICVAAVVQMKAGFDFIMANNLQIADGFATGKVFIPDYFRRSQSALCGHGTCKSNVLPYIKQQYGVDYAWIMAVGDGVNDVCMVKHAGIGVAFCSAVPELNDSADLQIGTRSFRQILDIAL